MKGCESKNRSFTEDAQVNQPERIYAVQHGYYFKQTSNFTAINT